MTMRFKDTHTHTNTTSNCSNCGRTVCPAKTEHLCGNCAAAQDAARRQGVVR